ncbi:hypothetical protein BDV95DRAFT_600651 [Massariosphaeria phaeospora]|uniref:glutathione transferase n=1 Tax=Massariosphaeria phaeospora TaxID=100035 RepID=A0A7C8MNX2_9PLEO|nr:hypothetical protein BDV95DRAFT_600651 [Massariosphaeria phaeospora]
MATHSSDSDPKITLYVIKSTPTSGANIVKVLSLIEALSIDHNVQVVPSTKNDIWFHRISPTKMVPALEGLESNEGKRLNVFESSSCLEYLVDQYDDDGLYGGKNIWERTQVRNWLTMHTAGLGSFAKMWLTFKRLPAPSPSSSADVFDPTINHFSAAIESEYTCLDTRLSEPNQYYIALPDRPTITDFATFPFANTQVAQMAGIDFEKWPKLKAWSEQMMELEAVKVAMKRATEF